jgi:hypothetical protein
MNIDQIPLNIFIVVVFIVKIKSLNVFKLIDYTISRMFEVFEVHHSRYIKCQLKHFIIAVVEINQNVTTPFTTRCDL